MDVNEARVCGIINSEILSDADSTVFNPIRFSIRCGKENIFCLANELLAIKIQRTCIKGVRVLVCGSLTSRVIGNVPRMYINCNEVILESESGFLQKLNQAPDE